MNFSVLLFTLWALVGATFLLLTLGREPGYPWAKLARIGDTSIGRNSVNWLAALALSGALMICLFLD